MHAHAFSVFTKPYNNNSSSLFQTRGSQRRDHRHKSAKKG